MNTTKYFNMKISNLDSILEQYSEAGQGGGASHTSLTCLFIIIAVIATSVLIPSTLLFPWSTSENIYV